MADIVIMNGETGEVVRRKLTRRERQNWKAAAVPAQAPPPEREAEEDQLLRERAAEDPAFAALARRLGVPLGEPTETAER